MMTTIIWSLWSFRGIENRNRFSLLNMTFHKWTHVGRIVFAYMIFRRSHNQNTRSTRKMNSAVRIHNIDPLLSLKKLIFLHGPSSNTCLAFSQSSFMISIENIEIVIFHHRIISIDGFWLRTIFSQLRMSTILLAKFFHFFSKQHDAFNLIVVSWFLLPSNQNARRQIFLLRQFEG